MLPKQGRMPTNETFELRWIVWTVSVAVVIRFKVHIYIASNGGVVSEYWIGKDLEGDVHGIAWITREEYFSYLCSLITNDARCTLEIKCNIAIAKVALDKNETFVFTSRLHVNSRKKLRKCYVWSIALYGAFVWCWKLNTTESRSEIPGKSWNVVQGKNGWDHNFSVYHPRCACNN